LNAAGIQKIEINKGMLNLAWLIVI